MPGASTPHLTVRIALVGDYDARSIPHRAIPKALTLASHALEDDSIYECEWVHSRQLVPDAAARLANYHGIWCVPGSPYTNPRGVLDAIRFARLSQLPFLGTCAGFQHALLEYAEAVWSLPITGPDLVIAPLACLLDQEPGRIHLQQGSKLGQIYGSSDAVEIYHCSYGLNPAHSKRFEQGELKISARADDGSVRAIELESHPFFIATLFQPERAALSDLQHPLIQAFVAACRDEGS